MSSIEAKWPETPSATLKWHTLTDWQYSLETSSRFFENQPYVICSHLRRKRQKARFLSPRSSKIIVTKENGKEKKKERGAGKEEKKKAMVALLYF